MPEIYISLLLQLRRGSECGNSVHQPQVVDNVQQPVDIHDDMYKLNTSGAILNGHPDIIDSLFIKNICMPRSQVNSTTR